jgi:hypothetical protein
MDQRAPEEDMQRVTNELIGYTIQELGRGRHPAHLEAELTDRGLGRPAAVAIVERALAERSRVQEAQRNDPIFAAMHKGVRQGSAGSADMVLGALICLGGILISTISYSAASGGGTYVVATGAIVFGMIRFFKGVASL